MTKNKILGLVSSIYGVLLNVFCIYSIIPLISIIMFEDLYGTEKKLVIFKFIIWLIILVVSDFIIAAGKNKIISDESNDNNYQQNSNNNFKSVSNGNNKTICPKCGAQNSTNSNYCSSCCASLRNTNHLKSSNEWKCPKCGRINQEYTGTCGCGESKPR